MASGTFSSLKTQVLKMIADDIIEGPPLEGTDNDATLLKLAIHAGIDAILPMVWKRATSTVTGAVTSATLPTDLYEIQGVLDVSDGTFLENIVVSPGQPWGSNMSGNGYIEYPNGTLTFSNTLSDDGAVVYYAAMWSKPEDDEDTLEPPAYSHNAIALYAASYCLLGQSSSAGGLAQYKTRVESGTPEDNPLERLSTYFLNRFNVEMERMPVMQKGVR